MCCSAYQREACCCTIALVLRRVRLSHARSDSPKLPRWRSGAFQVCKGRPSFLELFPDEEGFKLGISHAGSLELPTV
jgi:hypothetical protein